MGVRAGRGFLLRPTRPIKRGRVRFVFPEMVLTGTPVATVAVDTVATPVVTLGTQYVVSGATAAVTVTTGDSTVSGDLFEAVITAGELVVYADAAEVAVAANTPGAPLVGSYMLGNPFAAPVLLTGQSGRSVADLTASTVEAGEPTIASGATRSFWFAMMSPAPAALQLVVSAGTGTTVVVEVFAGTSLADLELLGTSTWTVASLGATPPLVVDLPLGTPHFIRVTSGGAGDTGYATLDYTLSPPGDGLVLQILESTINQAPDQMDVVVFNADPDWPIDFYVLGSPTVISTGYADSEGVLQPMSVEIPLLDAGTYTLVAQMRAYMPRWDWIVAESPGTGLDTFQVLHDPPERPTDLPLDDLPVLVAQGYPIRHWVLQDAQAGGLGSYVLPRNPRSASSPHPVRELANAMSVGAAGQVHVWEGVQKPRPWTFSGFITDQAMLDEMQSYFELPRRFFIVDHHNRAWTVTWDRFAVTMNESKKGSDFPYSHTYEASVTVFAGPSTPA